jgi:hypothetical protein
MVIEMTMSPLSASALAAAIVAAASVLAFSYLPDLFVWAAFIAWASYDHSGADRQAALRSSAALIFGVAMAWAVALAAAAHALPLNEPQATAICAGTASFFIVMASRISSLSVVPATFYGFASTFACLSLAPGAFTLDAMTAFGWKNPIIGLPVSLLCGTGLGVLHGWLAKTLAAGGAEATPRRALSLGGSAR